MRGTRARWFALGLAGAGIVILLLVARAEIDGGALLTLALGAAILVLLLPVVAYFVFRRE